MAGTAPAGIGVVMHTAAGLGGVAARDFVVGAMEEVTAGGTWVVEAMDGIWEAPDVVQVDRAAPAGPALEVAGEVDLRVAVPRWAAEGAAQAGVAGRRWVVAAAVVAVQEGPVLQAAVAEPAVQALLEVEELAAVAEPAGVELAAAVGAANPNGILGRV